MNALEQFHEELDKSNWDINDESLINDKLIEVEKTLASADDKDDYRKANIERQVFNFSKTPDGKLSYRVAGTQTLEDGKTIPFEWPDIRAFEENDFQYVLERFKVCSNLYAKAEYGLVLYYANHKKDNEFVLEILNTLLKLSKSYYEKAVLGGENNMYSWNLHQLLYNALYIASLRKNSDKIEEINQQLTILAYNTHIEWKIEKGATLDFTDLAIEYFKSFDKYTNLSDMLAKNWKVAQFLSKDDHWGAIFVADISIKLCKKLKADSEQWLKLKALQYEQLAFNAIEQKNISAISFIEKGLTIYKELKDLNNIKRLENLYQQYRGTFELGQYKTEMPQNETQRILEEIRKTINSGDENTIISILLDTPMIRSTDEIRTWSEDISSQSSLTNILPVNIEDKFGNTIAKYISTEEIKEFQFLDTYGNHLQIASQILLQFVIEALKADKFKFSAIIKYLEQTWLNNSEVRIVNGQRVTINYLETLKPGLFSFYTELEKWHQEVGYNPNFILSTDSLVLKVEYLLREICYKLNIATFKAKPNNPEIIMEKTLDELLNNLKDKLEEGDRFFIKFILTEKVGENLRNRVAHGLLDNIDYSIMYPIYTLICILKLSNYGFIKSED
jgi:hypothetical protein